MSAIRESGMGFGGTDKDYPSPTSDVIISQYENKLNGSIARKTIAASKEGKSPFFTKEEMDYLTKKAIDDSPYSEVKVITPAPSITLKKGNTEINIKHAAELVQRMEELYPKGMAADTAANINAQPFRQASFEHGLKESIGEPSVKQFSSVSKIKNNPVLDEYLKEAVGEPVPPRPPVQEPKQEPKSVNKNAYEIRLEVLKEATEFVKWHNTISNPSTVSPTSSDDVLHLAQKFYKFVENRR